MEEIAKIFDERGYFQILATYKYENGKKVGRPKFVECITITSADLDFLQPIIAELGGKPCKTAKLYKLSYSALKAEEVIKKIYPYLVKQKEKARILYDLSKHKKINKMKTTENFLYRQELKNKLESI